MGNIYKITNLVNNKIYVGCTKKSLNERFDEHISRAKNKKHKSKLYNSIRKYGIENFLMESIESIETDFTNLLKMEIEYIKKYDSFNNGMNSTLGGEGNIGYKHSDATKEKITNQLLEKSKKGIDYKKLYGDRYIEEKQKRSNKVKEYWNKLDKKERSKRSDQIKKSLRSKSLYSIEIITKIKQLIKEGKKNKEILNLFPDMKYTYLSSIKSGYRWSDIII